MSEFRSRKYEDKRMFRRFLLMVPAAVFLSAMSFSAVAKATDDDASWREVKMELAEAGKAVRDYSIEQREEAIETVSSALASIDNRIAVLEARIDSKAVEMSAAAQAHSRAAIRELRTKREQVAEWYGGLKHGSAEAWDEVKTGFSKAYEDLRASLNQVEKES